MLRVRLIDSSGRVQGIKNFDDPRDRFIEEFNASGGKARKVGSKKWLLAVVATLLAIAGLYYAAEVFFPIEVSRVRTVDNLAVVKGKVDRKVTHRLRRWNGRRFFKVVESSQNGRMLFRQEGRIVNNKFTGQVKVVNAQGDVSFYTVGDPLPETLKAFPNLRGE